MSTPTLGTIFNGNVAVVPGFDTASTGVGNFAVANRALIGSQTAADSYLGGQASLKVLGGASIEKNLMIGDDVSVRGSHGIEGSLDVGGTSAFHSDVDLTSVTEVYDMIGPASLTVRGGTIIHKHVNTGHGLAVNQTPFAFAPVDGQFLRVGSSAYTDAATAGGATVPTWSASAIEAPAVTADNADVTFTDATSFRILGGPAATGGLAITESYAVRIQEGRFYTSDATESTGVGYGSIITDGGLSVRKDTYQNGVLYVVNQSDSDQRTGLGGALVVSGAVNLAKELKLGTGIQSNLDQPIRTLAGAAEFNNFIFQNDLAENIANVGIGNSAAANPDYLGNYYVQAANRIIFNAGDDATAHQFTILEAGNVLVHAPGADGTVRISPVTAGAQASIAFYTDDTYDAASTTAGDVWTAGKAALDAGAQDFAIGTNVFGTVVQFGADGVTHFPHVLDSLTVADGAFTLAGGAALGKHLNVGFGANLNQTAFAFAPADGQFLLVDNSAYTDDATAGGATVATWSAAAIQAPAVTADNAGVTYTDATSFRILGGPAATGGLAITESYAVRIQEGRFYTSDATESTGVGYGSIITDGGLSVRKDTYQNGVLYVVNQSDSDQRTGLGGALVVSGAINLAKELKLGTGIQSNLNEPIRTLAAAAEYNNFIFQNDLAANIANVGIGNSAAANPDYLSNYYVQAANRIVFNAGDDATGHQFTILEAGNALFHSPGADGSIRISPRAAGEEASISFYTDDTYNAASTTIGDYWIAGKNAWTVGTQNFSIGTNGTGNVIQLDADGVVRIPLNRDSDDSGTGALVVQGGAGFGRDVSIAGELRVTDISNFDGVVTINNTTASGNDPAVGALIVKGDISTPSNVTIGTDLHTHGATTLTGLVTAETDLQVNRDTNITRNLSVGGAVQIVGDTVITGLLTIGTGDAQQINTVGLTIEDNFLLVNAGPGGTADAGVGVKRFQTANDAGAGDVVRDDPLYTGTAAAGATATTLVLGADASAVDGFYDGSWVVVTDGTGVDQVRRINTYAGATRTATLYTTADQDANGYALHQGMDWTTVPDATSRVSVFNTQHVAAYWNEDGKEWVFASAAQDPTTTTMVNMDDTVPIHVGDLTVDRVANVDTIVEKNTDAGVTVETVNFKDGNLTNVVSVNGIRTVTTDLVTIADNGTETPAVPHTATHGCYMIFVEDVTFGGAAAVFMLAGANGRGGQANRISSVAGANEESLGMTWFAGDVPRLVFVDPPVNATGATLSYNVYVHSTL